MGPALTRAYVVCLSCRPASRYRVADLVRDPPAEANRRLPGVLRAGGELSRLLDENRIVRLDESLRLQEGLQGFITRKIGWEWGRVRTVVSWVLDLEQAPLVQGGLLVLRDGAITEMVGVF